MIGRPLIQGQFATPARYQLTGHGKPEAGSFSMGLARPKPQLQTEGTVQAQTSSPTDENRIRRSDQQAILSALAPAPVADGEAATILTLRDSMCKWPIGDPADPQFAFCGRKSDCGPYCAEHAKVAFQPQRKRERKREDEQEARKIAG